MHRLEKELLDLVQSDTRIFRFIEHSSLDGMWHWDLENAEHFLGPYFSWSKDWILE
ncbi:MULTISPECIES: multi-sensor hybrid histidine kinase [unclassified Alteromonas]|uniref:multi-sensor hybrid histidine kinase n=1 Tax=unclassified Alteromonas TaxID=2614992 RepID=UPI001EF36483|nr:MULTISPECIES: multi-sensor hybrid histidine kinase [unclassified Alteromonas]MCG7639890.1 multi-sensor hybrid histidine kinase [Alteromonas sp. CNT1-28]MCG7814608.1 multi-sensor hybrid histidine kinase [Alteromonas sp. MCA-1]